ncbi:MAG: ABC transporter permease [Actinomycetia bacterium]|nr:ABC transporter permease [Actinomycetes bacterium]
MTTKSSTTPADQTLEIPPRTSRRGRSTGRRKRYRYLRSAATAIGALAFVIVVWEAIVRFFEIPLYLVAAPSDVWTSLVDDRSILLENLWPTTVESVLGFLLGNLVAVILAIIFVYNKALEEALFPLAIVLRTVPIVAIAPVLVLMLGTGYAPKIIIAALISFFPTLVNMVKGFRAVDAQVFELMQVLSASKREVFSHVRIYSSLPFLFAALKIAAPAAVIGAIVAEWIGAKEGLGYLIIQATYNFNTPLLYSTMLLGSVLSIAFFVVIGLIEKATVRWETTEQA